MQPWFLVFVCIAVPISIGLAMYVAFGVWDQRRRHSDDGAPPIDYQI